MNRISRAALAAGIICVAAAAAATGEGPAARSCASEQRFVDREGTPRRWMDLARCEQARGKRDKALAAWRWVIEYGEFAQRYQAYEALAALGVRIDAPDVDVSADRDPATYESTCVKYPAPPQCGGGAHICSQFKDYDDASDGRREVRVFLAISRDGERFEQASRARDEHSIGYTGSGFQTGSFTYQCLPRDRCGPIECGGLTGDAQTACLERGRAACDAELSKCPAKPDVKPAACAVVFVDSCFRRVGLVCNGRAHELSAGPELARDGRAADAAPPPGEVSAGVLRCCTGNVWERSADLPPAAELMAAFHLGTRPLAGKHYIFQTYIAEALIKLGDRSVMPALRDLLKSASRETRVDAAWVLARLGDDEGIAMVMAEARDRSPEGRTLEGRTMTGRMLGGQIGQDRYYAVRTLGMIGDRRAVPLLCELVQDPSLDAGAAYALSQIGDPRAIPALWAATQRARGQSQVYVAKALATLGDRRGEEVLVGILKDPAAHPYNREIAAEELGKLKAVSSVPALIEALRDPVIDARVGAARALGDIGDASALPALTEALKDASQTVTHGPPITLREAAQAAIEKIRAATSPR